MLFRRETGDLKLRLKRKRNNAVWLMRLPAELLVNVFKLYIDEQTVSANRTLLCHNGNSEDWRREYRSKTGELGRWATVLPHVCHCWRELALHSPILWEDIAVCGGHGADKMDAYIQRSGATTPLAFHGYFHNSDLSTLAPAWGRAFQEAPRTKALFLEVCALHDALFPTFDLPTFPQLELLVLATPGNGGRALPSFAVQAGAFPALKTIYSQSYDFSALLPLFVPSVTKIDISCCLKRTGSSFSRTMLIEALRGLPRLEFLRLQNCIPKDEPVAPLALPSLKRILLLDFGAACVSLLEQMVFPGTASISLELEAAPYAFGETQFGMHKARGDDVDIEVYAPYIGRRLAGANAIGPVPPLRSLSVRWIAEQDWFSIIDDVYIRGWTTVVPLGPVKTVQEPEAFYFNTEDFSYYKVLAEFVGTEMPLQDVHTLLVDGRFTGMALVEWLAIFRKMTGVRELYVEGAAAHGLAEALIEWVQQGEHLFPNLSIVKFRGLQLYAHNAPKSRSNPPVDENWLIFLKRALQVRQALHGAHLDKIVIEQGWNIHRKDIDFLAGCNCISVVEWDGIVQAPPANVADFDGEEEEEEDEEELDAWMDESDSEDSEGDDEETKACRRYRNAVRATSRNFVPPPLPRNPWTQ